MAQKLILNFDGENESTDYQEEASDLSPGYNDYCQIDTSVYKFGSGSLLVGVDGNQAKLSYAFDEITGDFRWHGWVRPINSDTSVYTEIKIRHDVGTLNYSDTNINLLLSGDITRLTVFNADPYIEPGTYYGETTALPLTTWSHIAIVKKDLDVMLFVDGQKKITVSLPNDISAIGCWAIKSYGGHQMNIDAVEFKTGTESSSDFDVPTEAPALYPGDVSYIPCAEMEISTLAPQINVCNIPAAGMTMAGYAPYRHNNIPCAGMTMAGLSPSFGSGPYEIPLGVVRVLARNPSYIWELKTEQKYNSKIIYLCILTGDADGLSDLTIPISSFNAVMRDGDPSYLSCVIPNPDDYITGISSRQNGDITIRKGYLFSNGDVITEEIIRVDYENLQRQQGGRSDSAIISGHKTVSSTAPKYRALVNVTYYGLQTDGKRSYRADLDLFLRVGDIATYSGDAIVVGQIEYIVDTTSAMMYITEA